MLIREIQVMRFLPPGCSVLVSNVWVDLAGPKILQLLRAVLFMIINVALLRRIYAINIPSLSGFLELCGKL